MKKLSQFIIISILASSLMVACKKKEVDPIKDEDTPEQRQSDMNGSTAIDEGLEDIDDIINNKIGNGSSQNSRVAAYNLPCGIVSIDSSTTNSDNNKIYNVRYGKETPCGYKAKGGNIVFQLVSGTTYADEGAVFSVTFTNYQVEIVATGKTVTINGTIYTTNTTGGYIWQAVTSSATIIHKLRGTLNITYANNETRERKYFRLKTWTSDNGWQGLRFSFSGDTLINSVNVTETGYTLEGNYPFKTEIFEDFQWSNCGTTWTGPYVLKNGSARMNVDIPNVSKAHFNVEAGYNHTTSSSAKVNDCTSNAYKITSEIAELTNVQYQLY